MTDHDPDADVTHEVAIDTRAEVYHNIQRLNYGHKYTYDRLPITDALRRDYDPCSSCYTTHD